MPLGLNLLSKTISCLFSEVGIVGHFTNHSLRATAATHMFHAHSSTDGVCSYKRLSAPLKEMTSSVLNFSTPPMNSSELCAVIPCPPCPKKDKLDISGHTFGHASTTFNFSGASNLTLNFNY